MSVLVARLLVGILGVGAGPAKCAGKDCSADDSGDTMLALHAHLGASRVTAAQELLTNFDLQALTNRSGKDRVHELVELQKTVERIALTNKTVDYTSTSPTTKEQEAMIIVFGYMDRIIDATVTEHKKDITTLADTIKEAKKCNTIAEARMVEVDKDGKVVEENQNAHAACRTREAALQRLKKSFCKDLDDFVDRGWPQNFTRLSDCHDDLFMKAKTDAEIALRHESIEKALDWFEDVGHASKGCKENGDAHAAKQKQCVRNQTTFETGFCAYQKDHNQVCTYLDDCIAEWTSFLSKRKQEMSAEVNIRKAEHVAAKKVICFLDVLNKTQNRVDKVKLCKNMTISTDHLDITFPTIPAKYECKPKGVTEGDVMCDAVWLANTYTSQAWHTDAPAAECKQCPAPPATPAPTMGQDGVVPTDGDAELYEVKSTAFPQLEDFEAAFCTSHGQRKVVCPSASNDVQGQPKHELLIYDVEDNTVEFKKVPGIGSAQRISVTVGDFVVMLPMMTTTDEQGAGHIITYNVGTGDVLRFESSLEKYQQAIAFPPLVVGGKVYTVPSSAGALQVYDPLSNTREDVEKVDGKNLWSSTALIGSKIIAFPMNAKKALVYDTTTKTLHFNTDKAWSDAGVGMPENPSEMRGPPKMFGFGLAVIGSTAFALITDGSGIATYDVEADKAQFIPRTSSINHGSLYIEQHVLGGKIVSFPVGGPVSEGQKAGGICQYTPGEDSFQCEDAEIKCDGQHAFTGTPLGGVVLGSKLYQFSFEKAPSNTYYADYDGSSVTCHKWKDSGFNFLGQIVRVGSHIVKVEQQEGSNNIAVMGIRADNIEQQER